MNPSISGPGPPDPGPASRISRVKVLPLQISAPTHNTDDEEEGFGLKRRVGLLSAIALTVGVMIGLLTN
jgi:hypothetical protein